MLTRDALPGDAADGQSRYIEAAVGGVLIASLYAPNGNPQPGPKFAYKLAWHERLRLHAAELFATGLPVVLAGDYNVVPEPRDIYPTTSYDGNALVQPESRAAYARLLDQGWTDALRTMHPDATIYTFWDYRRNRWQRDGGMRLDHLLLGRALAGRLRGGWRGPRACAGARTPAITRRSGSSWKAEHGPGRGGGPGNASVRRLSKLKRPAHIVRGANGSRLQQLSG